MGENDQLRFVDQQSPDLEKEQRRRCREQAAHGPARDQAELRGDPRHLLLREVEEIYHSDENGGAGKGEHQRWKAALRPNDHKQRRQRHQGAKNSEEIRHITLLVSRVDLTHDGKRHACQDAHQRGHHRPHDSLFCDWNPYGQYLRPRNPVGTKCERDPQCGGNSYKGKKRCGYVALCVFGIILAIGFGQRVNKAVDNAEIEQGRPGNE